MTTPIGLVMPNALSLTLLVAVVTVGLVHLAMHATREECLVATAVTAAVAFSMVLVAPVGAALLVLAATMAIKLSPPAVPNTVPADWR